MNSPQLSLILPIYNVENYLEDCMESIIQQLDAGIIEILLIDDGSYDSSPTICDEYEKQYGNVKVFHKANGGLSDARNYGLIRASGKYISFIDSDDFLKSDTLKYFLEITQNDDLDVILGDADCVTEQGDIIDNPSFGYFHRGLEEGVLYTGQETIAAQLKAESSYRTTVWLGIYRREFLIENQLWFEKGLLHEDEMWTPKVLLQAKKVRYINKKFYCYRIRNNSIMRNKYGDFSKHVEAQIYIFTSLFRYFEWKVKDKELLVLLNDNLAKRYLHAIIAWQFVNYRDLYKRVNGIELFKKSFSWKNRVRAFILIINKRLFSSIINLVRHN